MITALARAKINPYLSVRGRRPDGYHELETIMQSISLADELTVTAADRSRINIFWAPGLEGEIPDQPDIVERTVVVSRFEGDNRPVIDLEKKIPIGAGLGGASADAAAALLALQQLQDRSVANPLDIDRLARQLGADVPFCLLGGTALATGIGDELEPMECAGPLWWAIGVSDVLLKTPEVYKRFDEMVPAGHVPSGNGSRGGATASFDAALRSASRGGSGAVAVLSEALRSGDVEAVALNLSNELEVAAFDLVPALRDRKSEMIRAGALGAVMTGSGSAIAGLCRDEAHAREVAAAAQPGFARVEVVHSTEVGAEVVSR
ncbi:MAG: 4-(cytidine 5'-diphospho)-2-C-methyl-D-erythritol kinase [Actinomycetota bacterium]